MLNHFSLNLIKEEVGQNLYQTEDILLNKIFSYIIISCLFKSNILLYITHLYFINKQELKILNNFHNVSLKEHLWIFFIK